MENIIRLSDLTFLDLELHDMEIIARAINDFGSGEHPDFGSGEHPMARAQSNINDFQVEYLLECLDKGIDACSDGSEFKEECTELWCNIHSVWTEHKIPEEKTVTGIIGPTTSENAPLAIHAEPVREACQNIVKENPRAAIDYCTFCCCSHVIGQHPRDGETEPQYWLRVNIGPRSKHATMKHPTQARTVPED